MGFPHELAVFSGQDWTHALFCSVNTQFLCLDIRIFFFSFPFYLIVSFPPISKWNNLWNPDIIWWLALEPIKLVWSAVAGFFCAMWDCNEMLSDFTKGIYLLAAMLATREVYLFWLECSFQSEFIVKIKGFSIACENRSIASAVGIIWKCLLKR